MLEKVLLHPIHHAGNLIDLGLSAADDEIGLSSGNLHAERPAQDTQVTVGRTEKLKLTATWVQLYC